jgi:transcriptional regulator with XRE-family HTH domain
MSSFGDRLKILRENKGFSKGQLAELIGIHYSQIGRYERNEASPSSDVLKKLANQLEITSDFLMNGTMEEIANDNIKDKSLINQFNKISKLNDENKKVVISLIDAFLFKEEMKKQLSI